MASILGVHELWERCPVADRTSEADLQARVDWVWNNKFICESTQLMELLEGPTATHIVRRVGGPAATRGWCVKCGVKIYEGVNFDIPRPQAAQACTARAAVLAYNRNLALQEGQAKRRRISVNQQRATSFDAHESALLAQVQQGPHSSQVIVQARANIDYTRIFSTLSSEIEEVMSASARDAITNVELRSRNAVLREGLRTVQSMVETGKLYCAAKHNQFALISNLSLKKDSKKDGKTPKSRFTAFNEICALANCGTEPTVPDFSKPLAELLSKNFIKFWQLDSGVREKVKNRYEDGRA